MCILTFGGILCNQMNYVRPGKGLAATEFRGASSLDQSSRIFCDSSSKRSRMALSKRPEQAIAVIYLTSLFPFEEYFDLIGIPSVDSGD